MLMDAHKTQRKTSAFVDFLEQYHKDDDDFLNHVVRIIGDEARVSCVNFET
jgi:pyruvate dehydrogenase complex dehydrogenase (E1) component